MKQWIRAVFLGLIVTGIPTTIWAVLATVNIKFTPQVPWSFAVMAVLLWFYWRFLQRTDARRQLLRANPLTPEKWQFALAGGGAAVSVLWLLFMALRGVLHVQPPQNNTGNLPIWTIAAAIVMGSAVAAICEEAGFRGFMQVSLERAYGPAVAIVTTSVIFTLAHLTHGVRILPFLPFYLAVAVVYALMARLSGSILPSMVLHFIGDVFTFTIAVLSTT